MNNEATAPIILSSNYSGACTHVPPTNEDLLMLTDKRRDAIYGPTLFALKYRAVCCTMSGTALSSSGGYDDVYTYNLTGQFSSFRRGRQWGGERRQGGMYHATR